MAPTPTSSEVLAWFILEWEALWRLWSIISQSAHPHPHQWRIQGGGGGRGSGPPPFGPRCRLFNIGPKVGPPLGPPPLFSCRPKMDPSGGSRVHVCVTGVITPPPPLGMWMTSHGQCPRGGGACECPRVGVFFNFSEGGWRHADNGWKILYPRLDPPPPFQKSWIRPCTPTPNEGVAYMYSPLRWLRQPWIRSPLTTHLPLIASLNVGNMMICPLDHNNFIMLN